MSKVPADVWVVAGPPGAGKTTVATTLLSLLPTTPALLDKDTIYGGFVEATLKAAARPIGDREGPWYDEHIKGYEYAGLTAVAKEIRSYGCDVMLSAPFTRQIQRRELWESLVAELGGETVRLVWVRSDRETLRHRIDVRASDRDGTMRANFDTFIARVKPDSTPPIHHIEIDNRLSAPATIEDQVRAALTLLAL